MLLQMDEALVGIHHLLQVDVLLYDVREGIFGVILFVHTDDFFQRHFGLHDNGGENAAREVATIGDEVYLRIEAVLQLLERLLDFGHVLVFEGFIDTQVVVAPTEVARGSRLHARAGAAGDGVHQDVAVQHQVFGKRKQAQLDAGGEATGICHVFRLAGGAAVQFRQTVDEIVVGRSDAVIHGEVNDSQLFGHVVALQELLRVAVGGAEEEHVNLVQGKLVGEYQIRFAVQSFVYVGNLVAGIA